MTLRCLLNPWRFNGVALERNNLDWNVQQGYSNRDGSSGGIYANYRGSQGSINGNYSYNKYSQLLNYGMSGTIIAHADGITLGQEMSDTAALIKAPGLSDVRIENDQTIETDFRGYAIYPYLSPYRRNTLTLDSTTLGEEMELPETSKKSVPTRGAITRISFNGNIGRRAFIQLLTASGNPVPFGATVVQTSKLDAPASIVSDGGLVYLSGLKETGELAVQWGKNADQQCKATYNLSDTNEKIRQTTATCR